MALSSNRFSVGESIHGVWQAQYLVRLEGNFACFTHSKCHMRRRSLMKSILRGRRNIWWGWRVIWIAPRIGNEASYVIQIINDIHFAWQAQYLVRLEGDLSCSTHWKWEFICDTDYWWHSFCVTGAIFGEVEGWLDLLHALGMRFHMSRRSLVTFILRGRRNIWWSWTVSLVAPRIVNDVSKKYRSSTL